MHGRLKKGVFRLVLVVVPFPLLKDFFSETCNKQGVSGIFLVEER